MRTLAWIGFGWLGVVFWTSAAVRIGPYHIIPDAAVVVVAFLALRREPVPLALVALGLGYLVGRQALGPFGLHESAMVICAIGVYMIAGHLAGSGTFFFGLISGAAVMGYHVTLYVLLYIWRDTAGFAGTPTALLIPSALATGALALVFHHPMLWFEKLLMPAQRNTGLSWH